MKYDTYLGLGYRAVSSLMVGGETAPAADHEETLGDWSTDRLSASLSLILSTAVLYYER